MGGNLHLINHLIERYLDFPTVLELMRTNHATRQVLINNNRYWYRLWKKRKYQKPKRYHYFHQGPLTYGCLKQRWKGNLTPQPDDQPLSEENLRALSSSNSCWTKVIESGYITWNPKNWRWPYLFNWTCAYQHTWISKPIHPLSYYRRDYDPQTNYHQLFLSQESPSDLKHRLGVKQRALQRALRSASKHQRYANYYHRDVAKARQELDTIQRAHDYYFQEINPN
jgi:hypothetical protein